MPAHHIGTPDQCGQILLQAGLVLTQGLDTHTRMHVHAHTHTDTHTHMPTYVNTYIHTTTSYIYTQLMMKI